MGSQNEIITTVLMNFDGNPKSIGDANGTYSINNITITSLQNKQMRNLILVACNAGHYSAFKNASTTYADGDYGNIAADLAAKINGSPVLASDGTVDIHPNLSNAYRSFDDKTFRDLAPGENRSNYGWLIYFWFNGSVYCKDCGANVLTGNLISGPGYYLTIPQMIDATMNDSGWKNVT